VLILSGPVNGTDPWALEFVRDSAQEPWGVGHELSVMTPADFTLLACELSTSWEMFCTGGPDSGTSGDLDIYRVVREGFN
jgi:hypothetical protein